MNSRLLAATAALGLLTGCVSETVRTTNPYPPVPAPMVETVPKPPVTGEALVWQPGHWEWNGTGYVWAAGEYVPAAGHGPLWQPGWWSPTPAGWSWQPAHWTS
jgi:hypothetical protein